MGNEKKKKKPSGSMSCSGGGKKLDFYYSPTSFSRSSGTSYNEISAPGSFYPSFQYCKGNASKVSLTLDVVLDINSNEDVFTSYTEFFKNCCPLDNKLLANSPPIVDVALSTGEAFSAILESYDSSITRYSPSMNPVEFSFNVSLIEVGGSK